MVAGWIDEERGPMKRLGRGAWVLACVLLAGSVACAVPCRAFADEEQADINLTLSAQVGAADAASPVQNEAGPASGSLQVATGDGFASVVVPLAFAALFASAALVLLIPPRRTRALRRGEAQNAVLFASNAAGAFDGEVHSSREQGVPSDQWALRWKCRALRAALSRRR